MFPETLEFTPTNHLFIAHCAAPTAIPEGGFWRRIRPLSEGTVAALTAPSESLLAWATEVSNDR